MQDDRGHPAFIIIKSCFKACESPPQKAQPTQHARAESACILCRAARRKSHALWINLLNVMSILRASITTKEPF